MSKETTLNKEILERSKDIILQMKFSKQDFDEIHEKFRVLQEDNRFNNIVEKINDSIKTDDLKLIMESIIKNMDIDDLIEIVRKIAENKDLVNFIQDLILKKSCSFKF